MSADRIPSVRETLAGKELLVTGFTGFLAKVLVAFLLDRASPARIVVLARGRRGLRPAQRIQRVIERSPAFRPLRDRHGDRLGAFLASRLEVVEGDVRRPLLGLDPRTLEALAPRIDAVIHVAGITDFEPDPRDGVAINVRGALHAAELAARTRGRRLIHVSTAFVAGQGSRTVEESLAPGRSPNGTRLDPEGELLAIESVCDAIDEHTADDPARARRERIEAGTRRALALGWPNLYTYTKGLGELLLAERDEVAITIVRPSIVECARSFPFEGWNEGVNTSGPLVWLIGTMHRRMPFQPKHRFDVVPVDSVARGTTLALASALRDRDARGVRSVWHLASSDHNPLTLGRALDLSTLARRRQYARSGDPFERLVLANLESVITETAPSQDWILPAAKKLTRSLRDALVAFDPEIHLPRALRERVGDEIAARAQKAGKALGNASRTIGQVSEMLRAYQPFVWDDDLVFRTDTVRRASALLSSEERELFGFDVHEIDWRRYWLEVQMPGLDLWSLPLLRGERAPEDPAIGIAPAIAEVRPAREAHTAEPLASASSSLGEDAE